MRQQEVDCFAQSLACDGNQIMQFDLIRNRPSVGQLSEYDAVFVGGSGDYSVVKGGDWLHDALGGLRRVAESGVPMFASCWGFQAISRAFGGVVVHERKYAELGTMSVELTKDGALDEVFAVAGSRFLVHSGHEDTVVTLPREAVLLASSATATNQALKLIDRPVYATQFHPELLKAHYLQRLVAYPRYVRELTGLSADEFTASCRETPQANKLLPQFVRQVVQRIED